MLNEDHARLLLDREMLDRDGHRIGKISQVFVDDRTGEPTWVTVTTGWFGLSQSFVPLNRVQWSGDRVLAAYDTVTIKDAPRFAADQPLTAQDEDTLHAHYGLCDSGSSGTRLPQQLSSGDATGSFGATTHHVRTDPGGARGRLHRYEPPPARGGAESTNLGGAALCPQCGAYIASDMRTVHDTFHRGVAPPPGGYARHDIEDTEPPGGLTSPAGGYALRDVDVTAPTVGRAASSR